MATFSASFRVMGKDLEPNEVSRLLLLTPDQSHKAGDSRIGKSGRRYSDFSEGFWSLDSSAAESLSLDEHLMALLSQLQGRAEALETLKESGHRIDIFVGAFGNGEGNLGFSISSHILRDLGELGIKLEFDVHD